MEAILLDTITEAGSRGRRDANTGHSGVTSSLPFDLHLSPALLTFLFLFPLPSLSNHYPSSMSLISTLFLLARYHKYTTEFAFFSVTFNVFFLIYLYHFLLYFQTCLFFLHLSIGLS